MGRHRLSARTASPRRAVAVVMAVLLAVVTSVVVLSGGGTTAAAFSDYAGLPGDTASASVYEPNPSGLAGCGPLSQYDGIEYTSLVGVRAAVGEILVVDTPGSINVASLTGVCLDVTVAGVTLLDLQAGVYVAVGGVSDVLCDLSKILAVLRLPVTCTSVISLVGNVLTVVAVKNVLGALLKLLGLGGLLGGNAASQAAPQHVETAPSSAAPPASASAASSSSPAPAASSSVVAPAASSASTSASAPEDPVSTADAPVSSAVSSAVSSTAGAGS